MKLKWLHKLPEDVINKIKAEEVDWQLKTWVRTGKL